MSIDIRLPNITGASADEKMAQMQSYMHQLVQQLNWALNTVNEAAEGNASNMVVNTGRTEVKTAEEKTPVDTFNSIKALIIKSADIVNAYEETMTEHFNGKYFAESDFGTYLEETKAVVDKNSTGVTELYSDIQKITNKDSTGSLDVLSKDVIETNAYIKRGLLGYDKVSGEAVYGIAVGETDEKGNYKKYAWFTSDKLTFFDGNGNDVAYISSDMLYITNAAFLGTVQFGGYKMDTSDGIAFTWIGV